MSDLNATLPDAARIIGQLRGGLLPNPEGFLAFISTQSDEAPRAAFRAEPNNARGIRDGRISGDTLPVIYEFPPEIIADGTWRVPATWRMVIALPVIEMRASRRTYNP